MIPRSPLGLAVLAATVANAFMIPSTMSLPDVELDLPQALRNSINSLTRVSEVSFPLDCPGCAFPDPSNEDQLKSDVKNALLLNFVLSEDRTMLLLNDVPFYPFSVSLSHPIHARQMSLPSANEDNLIQVSNLFKVAKPRQLFYGAGFRMTDAADGTNERLIDMDFAITSLDQEHVDVDGITIRLFEDDDGKLTIGHVRTIPRANARILPPQIVQGTSCGTGVTSLLCRWRSFIESKLSAFGQRPGCVRRISEHHGPPFIKGGPYKFRQPSTIDGEAPPPHQWHHLHPDQHHHGMHRVGSSIRYIIVAFVIPVLVGVAAGMTASLLGMMVGTAIAWLWIKFMRGGRKGRASLDRAAAVAKEEIFVESDGLIDEKRDYEVEESEVEEPPVYVEKE